MLVLLCFGPLLSAAPKQSLPANQDPDAVLLETRKKVLATLRKLPNYLCTETVDRSTFEPPIPNASCTDRSKSTIESEQPARKTSSDRLRLDVAVSSSGEMYSWVGENRFHDRSLADLVGYGATLSGTFASFLITLFATEAATFEYNRSVNLGDRHLLEFSFRVPLEKSHYILSDNVQRAAVGYEGILLVNPKSFDLVGLSIQTLHNSIDAVCQVDTSLQYSSVQLNQSDFFFPRQIHLHMSMSDGSQSYSATVFSSCHEFLAESTLRFDSMSTNDKAATLNASVTPLALPPGLPLAIVTTQAIDTSTAAAAIQSTLSWPKQSLCTTAYWFPKALLFAAGSSVWSAIMALVRSR